jgi:hypothetical protein
MTMHLTICLTVTTRWNPSAVRPELGVVDAVPSDSLNANTLLQEPTPLDRFPYAVTVVADRDESPDLRAEPVDQCAGARGHRHLNLAARLRVAWVRERLKHSFDHILNRSGLIPGSLIRRWKGLRPRPGLGQRDAGHRPQAGSAPGEPLERERAARQAASLKAHRGRPEPTTGRERRARGRDAGRIINAQRA